MMAADSSGQLLPNDTMNRMADWTGTHKLTIPIFEKHDQTNAIIWWRKFVQYIKMTKDMDFSTMRNSREILKQNRYQLEIKRKDIFLWATGQNAIAKMTENGQRQS